MGGKERPTIACLLMTKLDFGITIDSIVRHKNCVRSPHPSVVESHSQGIDPDPDRI